MRVVGKNEPCPCGSGKKYKRCHGMSDVERAQLVDPDTLPKTKPGADMGALSGAMGGFDPNSMDPEQLKEVQKLISKMPKGQLRKLQGLMQRAMNGQDVMAELAQFESLLPGDFKNQLEAFSDDQMDFDEARKVLEEAVERGEVSREDADALLAGAPTKSEAPRGMKKLWSRFKK